MPSPAVRWWHPVWSGHCLHPVKIQFFQDLLFHLTDSMEILASFQACHAFTLGLDLGLSLSRELSQFQEEP